MLFFQCVFPAQESQSVHFTVCAKYTETERLDLKMHPDWSECTKVFFYPEGSLTHFNVFTVTFKLESVSFGRSIAKSESCSSH